jgi:tetratricopeptide (TPR) repeat protein
VHADGAWIEGPTLDWNLLPTRVEAVIESRVIRLDPELRETLRIASVEGEQFTAQIVASVQDLTERSILRSLQKLEKLYRLVREIGDIQSGEFRRTRYQFSHILVQEYVYQQLSVGEQRVLHGEVAIALAHQYRDQQEEVAAQLAHHFYKAEIYNQAFRYAVLAAEKATSTFAHYEAITLYTLAIKLAPMISLDATALINLLLDRGQINEISGDFERARTDYETALNLSRTAGQRSREWRALLDLAELWTSRNYNRSLEFIDLALDLANRMDEPALLAGSLNWVGNWHTNAENPAVALGYHQKALKIFERLKASDEIAHTLDQLGLSSMLRGDFTNSVRYYDRAIALFRERKDHSALAASLTGRGLASGGTCVNLTTPAPNVPVDARCDLCEALQIAREIDSPSAEAWSLWSLSLVNRGQGQFGEALECTQNALEIASRINHREWMAGSHSILGALYTDILAPEEARPHLEQALILSQKLRSQHWYHHTCGALAATWCLLGDPAQALAYLTPVITRTTAMDTLLKRMCWARRAELALYQEDPSLALDIVNRLIASTLGKSSGRVTPFLWLLKGDALAAAGKPKDAHLLLQAAVDNAQAPEERFLLWRIHASLGSLRTAMHHREEAKYHFVSARQLIEELAQTIPDKALRNNFLHRADSMFFCGP